MSLSEVKADDRQKVIAILHAVCVKSETESHSPQARQEQSYRTSNYVNSSESH